MKQESLLKVIKPVDHISCYVGKSGEKISGGLQYSPPFQKGHKH